jgi:plastocyanin domain-containing protein
MSTLLVNLGGIILMGAIVWWFWLSSSENGHQDDHSHH